MNKKSGGVVVAKVEQLGVVVIVDDEYYFLVMLRLKDLQWSCNSKCHANLHTIFHIKMIFYNSFTTNIIDWINKCAFFWWCQDWRISNHVTLECQMNLHAFYYIEIIKVTPLIATIIWFNSKETYLYIHGNHFSHLLES